MYRKRSGRERGDGIGKGLWAETRTRDARSATPLYVLFILKFSTFVITFRMIFFQLMNDKAANWQPNSLNFKEQIFQSEDNITA